MEVDRRALLAGAGAALLAGPVLAGTPVPPQEPVSPRDRISRLAHQNLNRITYADGRFSGTGWDWLLERARESHFFLLGEQHGIAENARFAGALFRALAPAGYQHAVIEISPPMATAIDAALRTGGMPAYRRLAADPASRVAFFGMREEAEWLAEARAAVPGLRPVLWGVDYEVGADRHLIRLLKARPKPPAAQRALAALESASQASWARYEETHSPQHIFSFAGDPALVAALRAAWPRADAEAVEIMDTLQGTFEINRLWVERRARDSNDRRARLIRANFLARWRAARRGGRLPRVMLKLGANHLVRGLNGTGTFDLGTLVPEIAAVENVGVFQLLVLNGIGSQIAQLDPTTFRYRSAPSSELHDTLAPIVQMDLPEGFTLFETAPLRGLARPGADGLDPELVRIVNGYDAILLMTGSTPSTNL